jgi:uncharacterized membrane protein
MLAWAVWNLFLASIPIPFAFALARRLRDPSQKPLRLGNVALFVAWLLLLPNAPYLLTEIRHFVLDDRFRAITEDATRDPAALRLSAAWGTIFLGYGVAGLVAYVIAVRPLERAVRLRGASLILARAGLSVVVALGVWLGLIPRFNSWDALLWPGDVLGAAWWALTHPATTASIGAFAVVLFVLHAAMDVVFDALLRARRRLGRRRPALAGS